MKLDPSIVQQQIANILVAVPELRDDCHLRADMIEAETDAFVFLSKLVRMIGDAGALAGGTQQYIAELRERQARIERRIEGLRSLVFKVMESADLSKCELAEATLSIRKGVRKVIITDEASLPSDAFRVTREPDKQKLRFWMDAGQEVPGAILSNGDETLSIRIK
jgi:hypothetical protein